MEEGTAEGYCKKFHVLHKGVLLNKTLRTLNQENKAILIKPRKTLFAKQSAEQEVPILWKFRVPWQKKKKREKKRKAAYIYTHTDKYKISNFSTHSNFVSLIVPL